jgi:hypothetical protein
MQKKKRARRGSLNRHDSSEEDRQPSDSDTDPAGSSRTLLSTARVANAVGIGRHSWVSSRAGRGRAGPRAGSAGRLRVRGSDGGRSKGSALRGGGDTGSGRGGGGVGVSGDSRVGGGISGEAGGDGREEKKGQRARSWIMDKVSEETHSQACWSKPWET